MYFVEVDRGSENMRTIRQKVTQFQSWYELTGKEDLMALFREGGLIKTKPNLGFLAQPLSRLPFHDGFTGAIHGPGIVRVVYQCH